MNRPVVAIVVAAGSGVRLGGGQPKALRLLGGRPLVWHALSRLAAAGVEQIVVVLPAGREAEFEAALADITVPWSWVVGGVERQESVRNGLAGLDLPAGIVLVHDAARPLAPAAVVSRVIDAVRAGAPAVIPVVPVIDTIRLVQPDGSVVVDRSRLRAVQTPQGFDLAVLVKAHGRAVREGVEATDDAALCEYAGHQVRLVDGSRESLKITEPMDLIIAEQLLAEVEP